MFSERFMISGGYAFFYKICHHRSLIFQISRSVDFLSDGCKRFAISFPSQLFPAKLPSPISMGPQFLFNITTTKIQPTSYGFYGFWNSPSFFPPQKIVQNPKICNFAEALATKQKPCGSKACKDPPPGEVRRFLDREMGYTSKKKIEKTHRIYRGNNEPYSYDMML